MDFQTTVDVAPLGFSIDYQTRGFAVGSCFAQNVALALRHAQFDIESNPFGVMFNPASVVACLKRLSNPKPYTTQDTSTNGQRWYSFEHHGSLSDISQERCLAQLNRAQELGAKALAEAHYVVITLGTAWVYERDGRVVANCHKCPSSEFIRRALTVDQIEDMLSDLLSKELKDKDVVLTVSPIRHIKDGLAENSLSKSTLIVACNNVARKFDNVHYFPSYEIVVDELRDYRFYERDMLHPSELAIDIVVERFCDATMNSATKKFKQEFEKLSRVLHHRPLDAQSDTHKELICRTLSQIDALKAKIRGE